MVLGLHCLQVSRTTLVRPSLNYFIFTSRVAPGLLLRNLVFTAILDYISWMRRVEIIFYLLLESAAPAVARHLCVAGHAGTDCNAR